MAGFIKKPDAQRIIFQRHQIHNAFIKILDRQNSAWPTRAAIGFYRDAIVYFNLLCSLNQAVTIRAEHKRRINDAQ